MIENQITQTCDGCGTSRALTSLEALETGGWREVKEGKHACVECINRLIHWNTAVTTHVHRPVQHRDGKPPWCEVCKLDANFEKPMGFGRQPLRLVPDEN